MIVIYARVPGKKKRQTLKRLGKKLYRVAAVTHRFARRDLPNPLIGETHYIDVPGAEIALVEV
jgi:hypothetical protein